MASPAEATSETNAFIWNEMLEVGKHFPKSGEEITFSTSSGRQYTVASKVQAEDGTWRYQSAFIMTLGNCTECKKFISGHFMEVFHGEDHYTFDGKLLHQISVHPDIPPKSFGPISTKVFFS